MKKIFTLLFSVGAFVTSFAQYNQGYPNGGDHNVRIETKRDDQYARNDRSDAYDRDHRFNDSYSFTAQEKDFQIAKINREFDFKVNSIKRNFFTGRREKRFQIEDADREREQQIRMVYARFTSSKNQCNSGGYAKGGYDNRDRDNNWKH